MTPQNRTSVVDVLGLRPRGQTTAVPVITSSVRFIVAGLANNALVYGLYSALVFAGIGSLLAVTLTFPVGMILSYLVQRFWSFRQRGVGAQSLIRFLILSGLDYSLNAILLWSMTEVWDVNPYLAQAVCIVIVASMNFLLMRYWVYRAEAPATQVGSDLI